MNFSWLLDHAQFLAIRQQAIGEAVGVNHLVLAAADVERLAVGGEAQAVKRRLHRHPANDALLGVLELDDHDFMLAEPGVLHREPVAARMQRGIDGEVAESRCLPAGRRLHAFGRRIEPSGCTPGRTRAVGAGFARGCGCAVGRATTRLPPMATSSRATTRARFNMDVILRCSPLTAWQSRRSNYQRPARRGTENNRRNRVVTTRRRPVAGRFATMCLDKGHSWGCSGDEDQTRSESAAGHQHAPLPGVLRPPVHRVRAAVRPPVSSRC